jgi:hypothetical protein
VNKNQPTLANRLAQKGINVRLENFHAPTFTQMAFGVEHGPKVINDRYQERDNTLVAPSLEGRWSTKCRKGGGWPEKPKPWGKPRDMLTRAQSDSR